MKFSIEYSALNRTHTVYRKRWWGGRTLISIVCDGGIVACKDVVTEYLLQNSVSYEFINVDGKLAGVVSPRRNFR